MEDIINDSENSSSEVQIESDQGDEELQKHEQVIPDSILF